jgi:predicted nucleotidyltransferase
MLPYQTIFSQYFKDKPVKKAYLFGSFARGETSENSDVDVLIDLDYEKGADFFLFIEMQENLSRLIGRKVDLVSSNGLSKFIKPIIDNEKQLIYEEKSSK